MIGASWQFCGRLLAFIRFSHTVFALPFALGSMVVATDGLPPWRMSVLIMLALVSARTAAMSFNRVVDWQLDQRNPRTAERHRLVPFRTGILLCAGSAIAFLAVSAAINPLCFALSPVALAAILFYSITKRFTSTSHFFLGLALAIAPVGAWLAVRGHFDFPPLVLALGVLLWVAGFDVIYATQDHDFDQTHGLQSLVVRLGVAASLRWAQRLHLLMFLTLIWFGVAAHLGPVYFASLLGIAAALLYEHRVVRKLDLAAINRAFFASNAVVGAIFVIGTLADRLA